MKINFSGKIKKIAVSKITIVVLVFLLFTISLVLIKKDAQIKGEVSKAYSVVVWDDNERRIVKSAYFNVEEILSENNIKVFPEDVLSSELILDPVSDGGAGQKIIIKRAPIYYVEVDGTVKQVRSWERSVSKIVAKTATPLGPKDQILPPADTDVTQGATIRITRINEADIDIFEDINFSAIEKSSTVVAFGQKKVIEPGKKGQRKKTYRVIYHNGIEVSRRLLSSVIVSAKEDKVTLFGIVTGRANFGYYSGMVTSFYKGMTGRYLLVTNLANGKQVKVKIIGSGPFNGPILDMGTEPFQAIGGKISDGFIPSVSVQLLD